MSQAAVLQALGHLLLVPCGYEAHQSKVFLYETNGTRFENSKNEIKPETYCTNEGPGDVAALASTLWSLGTKLDVQKKMVFIDYPVLNFTFL